MYTDLRTSNVWCSHTVAFWFQAVFTFLHNGSGIILGANVTLSLGQVAIANDTPTALLQRFVVNFVKLNETEPLIKRSGNPGYVPGAPLLAGNCTSSYPLQSWYTCSNSVHVYMYTCTCANAWVQLLYMFPGPQVTHILLIRVQGVPQLR